MMNENLEKFGRLLVEWVRDSAIHDCDCALDRRTETARSARWARLIRESSAEDAIREIIPDCVDIAIGAFLRAVDQEMIKISFAGEDREIAEIPEDELGTLVGWYMGADGWAARFSGQRFYNYMAEMKSDEFIANLLSRLKADEDDASNYDSRYATGKGFPDAVLC